MGRAPESVHAADGATGHRSDLAVQHGQGRLCHRGHQLGRSVGHHATGGRAWAGAQRRPLRTSVSMKRRFAKDIGTTRSCATWSGRRWNLSPKNARPRAWPRTTPADRRTEGGVAGGRDGHVGAVHRRDSGRPAEWRERIVFDRSPIMRDMTKAVDTVRKQEHREFLRTGEDSPLAGTRGTYGCYSDERRPEHHAEYTSPRCKPLRSESRAGVGDQGSAPNVVDVPAAGRREAVLHPVVRLGRALAARAREGGGRHAQASSRRRPPVRRSIRLPTASPKV